MPIFMKNLRKLISVAEPLIYGYNIAALLTNEQIVNNSKYSVFFFAISTALKSVYFFFISELIEPAILAADGPFDIFNLLATNFLKSKNAWKPSFTIK